MKTIIPKAWDIPEIFRLRMGSDAGRQRLMSEAGHHLVVLHEIPKSGDRGVRKPALFWIDEAEEWKSMPKSGGRSALKQQVQDYHDAIVALDDILQSAEGHETAEVVYHVLDLATPLYRAARNMAAVLQLLRKAMPRCRMVLELRDTAVATELMAELLVTDARSTLDYLMAKNASIQAKESKKAAQEAQKLNRLAAVFFPIVTLASFFGMNHPEDVMDHGGAGVLAFGLFIGVGLWLTIRKS